MLTKTEGILKVINKNYLEDSKEKYGCNGKKYTIIN